jgi:hypothetical protein
VQRAVLLGGVALALALAGAAAGTSAMAQAVVATGVGTPFELAFWQSIDSSSDPSLYEAYLVRFPNGTFNEIARAKIITLHGRLAPAYAPAVSAAPAVSPTLTVPVVPAPPPGPPPPLAPPAATYTQVAATAPVTPAPAIAQPAVLQPAVLQPAVIQSAIAQPAVVTPAAVTSAPSVVATGGAATAASAGTLGQLLAALANSQISGAPAVAATPAPVQAVAVQPAVVTPAPMLVASAASRTLAVGFAMPAPPALSPVPAVALPPSFCSAEARNAFHDAVYAPSINTAKQNNDAATAYMRQLQSLYDQYQLSHDPDTMNAIVGAARTYQQVAQTTFSMQSALVRQFTALMAVPVVPCSQAGQPPATTLVK